MDSTLETIAYSEAELREQNAALREQLAIVTADRDTWRTATQAGLDLLHEACREISRLLGEQEL